MSSFASLGPHHCSVRCETPIDCAWEIGYWGQAGVQSAPRCELRNTGRPGRIRKATTSPFRPESRGQPMHGPALIVLSSCLRQCKRIKSAPTAAGTEIGCRSGPIQQMGLRHARRSGGSVDPNQVGEVPRIVEDAQVAHPQRFATIARNYRPPIGRPLIPPSSPNR